MCKAVLFDMDGVLVDSEHLMLHVAAEALRAFDISAKPEDFEPYIGTDEENYFGSVMRKYGKKYTKEVRDHAFDVYGMRISSDNVCHDAERIISALKNASIPFAICSSANKKKIRHNLRVLGMHADDFDAVVSGEDVTRNKPDPEIYLTGAAILGISAKDCIVVEDSLSGIRSGKAAGAVTVGVGTTLTKAQFDAEGNADYYISELSGLPAVLARNGIMIEY